MRNDIKEWTEAWQLCVRKGRSTRKYQLGPPLPFDFLPEDQKAAIIAQKEAEEVKRKAEELKYILSGISGSGGQLDKQKEQKQKKNKKQEGDDNMNKSGKKSASGTRPTSKGKK
ncbi:MAG: hypothetical protein EZS28_039296 [Streblomastix strix]|uniref:Uncharacterized protein n=1 Tax=Streblomastix strix TaxID=222440 RepID=A0A5J4U4C8_9EUKA|nr:MAG: hypothetical protein EZS28_039296 [Streblomastix strix]